MNFLAHFHLAWPEEERVAGGLEGDYYKGPLSAGLSPGMAAGIRLHRAIDAFTDEHPRLQQMRAEFPPQLRRYAGIMIDLSFDHFLSRHWQDFATLSLQEFSHEIYAILDRQQSSLSEPAQTMAGRLREFDVLNRYHDWESVPASAARVGERFRRGNPLLETGELISPLRHSLEQSFIDFYPDLVRYCADCQGP